VRLCGAAALLVLLPLSGCAGEVPAPAVRPVVPAAVGTPGPRPAAGTDPVPAVPTARATLSPRAVDPPPPRRFRVPALQLDLPVVPVGVDSAGSMALPETVHQVAWYRFSARPGQPTGTTVLAAHVDTVQDGLGPFARLHQASEGDEMAVEIAGKTRRYVVTSVNKIAKSDVPLDQVFRRDGPPELKVITCGGTFSRRDGYRDNVIVTASPR
jgi:LPXTG-site transpeptidase (sortase) family protein